MELVEFSPSQEEEEEEEEEEEGDSQDQFQTKEGVLNDWRRLVFPREDESLGLTCHQAGTSSENESATTRTTDVRVSNQHTHMKGH